MNLFQPDAQDAPHYWLATFGGHLAIGIPAWLAMAWADPVLAVIAVAGLYLAAWEIPTVIWHGVTPALAWDAVLDTVGVTMGAMTAAYLWTGGYWQAVAACAAAAVVAGIGTWVRA